MKLGFMLRLAGKVFHRSALLCSAAGFHKLAVQGRASSELGGIKETGAKLIRLRWRVKRGTGQKKIRKMKSFYNRYFPHNYAQYGFLKKLISACFWHFAWKSETISDLDVVADSFSVLI